jgi:hypothetical protein
MTREEALALYRPIRASMRRILSAAFRVCNQPDVMRAAKQLGLWADGNIVLPEDDEAAEMLAPCAAQTEAYTHGNWLGGVSARLTSRSCIGQNLRAFALHREHSPSTRSH